MWWGEPVACVRIPALRRAGLIAPRCREGGAGGLGEDLADPFERGPTVGLWPVLFRGGIEPDGVAEAVAEALEPAQAGLGVGPCPGLLESSPLSAFTVAGRSG